VKAQNQFQRTFKPLYVYNFFSHRLYTFVRIHNGTYNQA